MVKSMRVINTVPRIVVSSYKGKVGKTTVTLALTTALIRAGYRVSMFKVGPDFIDPSYHSAITGKPSRNLDYVLMGDKVKLRFHKYSINSDIAVIEGVSGLYDSVDGVTEIGSTAQMAKILKAPVILVINGERINRTVRAIIRGLRVFDPEVKIMGVIITNTTPRQIDKLRKAVEDEGLMFVGYVPRTDELESLMQYRHLGLVHAQERDRYEIMSIINEVSQNIDIDKLMEIAKESEPIEFNEETEGYENKIGIDRKVRIGILTGRAFTFYYPEVIERAQGVGEVKFLNPEVDQEIGEVDLVLIGGGFPEIYGEALEKNRAFKHELRRFIEKGGYLYAECGGLMYLTNSIVYNNEEYEMVGVIDATTIMHRRPVWYGYAKARIINNSLIGDKGTVLLGHEFHYSSLILHGKYDFAIKYERGAGINGVDGFSINNAYAHYLHIHPETYDVLGRIVGKLVNDHERIN
ncbi:MAG: cobyrinate a,c-diamide synthase [Vulcanisaeta sp.]